MAAMDESDRVSAEIQSIVEEVQESAPRLSEQQAGILLRSHLGLRTRIVEKQLAQLQQEFLVPLIEQAKIRKSRELSDFFLKFDPAGAPRIGTKDHRDVTHPLEAALGADCTRIVVNDPTFEMVSGELSTPAPPASQKGLTTFSRATNEGTLEAAAATGHYPPESNDRIFPGATNCLGLNEINQSRATVGTTLSFPAEDVLRIVEVTVDVSLRIPMIFGSFWENFVYLQEAASPDVGINGGATAWASIALSLYSPDGRAWNGFNIVSGYKTALNPGRSYIEAIETGVFGGFSITAKAGIAPGHSTIGLMIDLEAFAAAQSTSADRRQPFAQIEFRQKPLDQGPDPMFLFGIFTPSVRFQIEKITANICPFPVL
ncbi:hypothetical protein ACGFNX_39105 [Streptomyces sp. NPDC048723]|uniref:hypothetical protein n=1 Tax=Streptomyces sp. NPDC048723 TaxID=3365589 RepID=UPI003717A8E1